MLRSYTITPTLHTLSDLICTADLSLDRWAGAAVAAISCRGRMRQGHFGRHHWQVRYSYSRAGRLQKRWFSHYANDHRMMRSRSAMPLRRCCRVRISLCQWRADVGTCTWTGHANRTAMFLHRLDRNPAHVCLASRENHYDQFKRESALGSKETEVEWANAVETHAGTLIAHR